MLLCDNVTVPMNIRHKTSLCASYYPSSEQTVITLNLNLHMLVATKKALPSECHVQMQMFLLPQMPTSNISMLLDMGDRRLIV